MDCPKCKKVMEQRCKPYHVGSGSGKSARVTEYECPNCGTLESNTVEVSPIVRDIELERLITFGSIE